MPQPSDELISVRECARRLGLNESTLRRQIVSGAIRSHGLKVSFAEVLEDRANNIDLARSERRRNAEPPDEDAVVLVDGAPMPLKAAQALKETYLARLRMLEFGRECARLIDRGTAEALFVEVARELRDAWQNWPDRVGRKIAAELGIAPAVTARVLRKFVTEHLAELGEPEVPDFSSAT